MPDVTIPDAAVEAAARTAWEMNRDDPRWFPFSQLTETDRGLVKGDAYAVLAAAAPHIAAQALKDMGEWFDRASQLGTGERDVIAAQACYDRANQIEAEHG